MRASLTPTVLVAVLFAGSLFAGCVEGRRWDRYSREDHRCDPILQRMDYDRDKISEIEPTGRHRDALQWYRDDFDNARRDLDRCRYGS